MRLVCAAARSKHRRYGNRLVLYPIYCMPGVERGKCGVLRRVATPDSTILPGCHCEKFSLLKEYYLTHKHGFLHNSATHYAVTSTSQGADKSLVQTGRKQATAIEDFEFHISYLLS